MSTAFRIGPFWGGFGAIRRLVVFGDSYSYVGYHSQAPLPTSSRPLGVPFPGTPLTEAGKPNWVGHLVTTYAHGRSNMLVYDYAVRGDTVPGVVKQISECFLPSVGRKPSWAPWKPGDTLFVTWVGTDDCRIIEEIVPIIRSLLDAHEKLYTAGARNFLFLDVPPIHRSPGAPNDGSDFSVRFRLWNAELRAALTSFAAAHSDATVILFSAWELFNRVLDAPGSHGFTAGDLTVKGGRFWFDHIHPTSKFHDILAREVSSLLSSI
ncbi:carbohydrate esterase family 16 protein [Auriscalpium vulgare]|uniref:Carbohydrate esterase family 16 protein n=1 Tax=Auriscalpium vulgare TaxID=40419 RepID=A0ACB8S2V1_9AGAM|nr:carbohydrate esterase family 16 protein [Auriscalpium vulgare]